jgi:hypothetical protein
MMKAARFKVGDLVCIVSSGYSGKIEAMEQVPAHGFGFAGGWIYKLAGGTWRAEEALELYRSAVKP